MPVPVLLLDGQHNHHIWPTLSECLRRFLIEAGVFEVEVCRAQQSARDFQVDRAFLDEFQAVVLHYNPNPGAEIGDVWPYETRQAFETYMREGGGLVVVHAANNAFAHWPAFNQMTGIGGWGGRDRNWGPYVYYDSQDALVLDRNDPDNRAGTDGPPHEYVVHVRDTSHPIMADIPQKWRHCQDEIYERLRGPADNLSVLATAFSDNIDWHQDATRRHEPLVMTIRFGQGRVFHTTMGHWTYSWQCAGLITLLQRGTEWAATGEVTQRLPDDFPTEDRVSARQLEWNDFTAREWTPYT